jgi:hypothetical protein
MKKIYLLVIFAVFISLTNSVKGQAGYVLLNEYMPWTTNTCTVNGEFIELYNFGPGPVNMGCYMITDGDFSITFPPNTIINAGQYFVLGGKDTIPNGCANIDSQVVVNLNWSTCNCTSGVIPTTGDGFLTDGGSANEQVILFDPNLKVVDAVVRKTPQEASSVITTNTMTGACVSKVFDLDTMTIDYETIGQSAGRGNSFARKLDGDCEWEKDPQQSGGATNNTSGSSMSSLASVLNITNANACSNNGSITITFTGVSDFSTLFPVDYILAKDLDSNNVFDLSDLYINGVDSTSPSVDIGGLSAGHYEIALQPKSGCNYQFYQFTILPCNTVLLEPNTFYFYAARQNKNVQLNWTAGKIERTQKFEIEMSSDGINFKKVQSFAVKSKTQSSQNFKFYDVNSLPVASYYRIKIFYTNNTVTYSSIKKIEGLAGEANAVTLFPNPVVNSLNVSFLSKKSQEITVVMLQADGKSLQQKQAHVNIGYNKILMETGSVQRGLYFIKVYDQDGTATVKKVFKQ